jgi:MFS family permease
VFVPAQAAGFATITPAATGRAATLFNMVRQLGGAIGVALLTTIIALIGATREVDGHQVANLTAYRITFLAAAAVAALGALVARTIRDADAAESIPPRRTRRRARRRAQPLPEPGPASQIVA